MTTPLSGNHSISVLIVDDHPLFREGLKAALINAHFSFLGEAATGEEAIRLARDLKPDVVLMDIRLPGTDGLAALREIKSRSPLTPVVVLTAYEDPPLLWEAFLSGAASYLLKGVSGDKIADVIHKVVNGEQSLNQEKLHSIMKECQHLFAQMKPGSLLAQVDLTERERQVLAAMRAGLSNRQIASRLGTELSTIKSHIYHLFHKIKVSDRTQAILWATVNGLRLPGGEREDGAARKPIHD